MNRIINRQGGAVGEVADNHRLVKSYIQQLRQNGSHYSADMFEKELEKPLGALAQFEKMRMKGK